MVQSSPFGDENPPRAAANTYLADISVLDSLEFVFKRLNQFVILFLWLECGVRHIDFNSLSFFMLVSPPLKLVYTIYITYRTIFVALLMRLRIARIPAQHY